MIVAFFPVEIVQPRFTHGGACFCMAQWAYSNHPADASYSSSLSRCTLPEPVFLFFTHSSGCRSPNLHFYCIGGEETAPSVRPRRERKKKKCYSVGYPRVYVVILMLEQNYRRPPSPSPSPVILLACQLAETDGLAQLRFCQAAELKTVTG